MIPHVKILILNWNGVHLLKTCLDSVTAIDYSNYSVVVIDNDSTDGSLEMVKKYYPNLLTSCWNFSSASTFYSRRKD